MEVTFQDKDYRVPEIAYSVEIDRFARSDWDRAIRDFSDLSVYQTWSWGKLSSGEDQLSHLVLKRNGYPVSMAQVRITTVPLLGWGMASVAWGPLWMRRDSPPDRDILRRSLLALREEYAEKRKLLLMVKPSITSWLAEDLNPVFREAGFRTSSLRTPYRTIVMDLSPPLDSLRKGMKPAWRRNLNKAERNNLEVESGAGENLLRELSELYRQMLARKQFTNIADFSFYEKLQRELVEPYKYQILVCRNQGAPVAGLICSPLGQTSLLSNGATGNRGLDLFGSYLLWWKAIEYLKGRGHRWMDTCGIDPVKNPGGYQFKTGVCGKWGRDIRADEFQYHGSYLSWLTARGGQSIREFSTRMKEFLALKRIVRQYEYKE